MSFRPLDLMALIAGSSWLVTSAGAAYAQPYPDDGCIGDLLNGPLPAQGVGNNCPDLWTENDFRATYFDDVPGTVSTGVGANPAGTYWVLLEWETNRRWAMRTIEDGHCETFCALENTDSAACPSAHRWLSMDGLKLRVDGEKNRWVSGMQARYAFRFEDIQGPYNKSNSSERHDWEWMAEERGSHCRTWATRRTPLMETLYWVQWNGTPITSVYSGQWFEPDGLGGEDWSVKRNLEVGKALTQCLQRNWQDAAPNANPARFAVTGPGGGVGSLYSYICQGSDPNCTSPGDYKIEVYFNVYCRIMRSTWPSGNVAGWTSERDSFREFVRADDVARYGRARIFLDAVFGRSQPL